MLYNDLTGDGKPAERAWREVYGILTGCQLAYWDAASLALLQALPGQLLAASSTPQYLNFSDAVFSAMAVLPAAKMQLENVLVVLTTLKNRYILQLRTYKQLQQWTLALRLAAYEHLALQEAYTGALLLARGLRLSDIRTILAPKRFAHEDWVKIRYGSGTAWKRCYAVVEPSTQKRKGFVPGRVLLYDLDSLKKKALVGAVTAASLVCAVYPQLPFFIDHSTIMKLECTVDFKPGKSKSSSRKSADSHETSLFLMPEQHSLVPGFDTLIRFLVPLYDAFGLYGRPQRLKADRVDPASLVFGLPTLPHVHYLTPTDLDGLVASRAFLDWDARTWHENIKAVLRLKMAHGYDGCGSSRGLSGAVTSLNSPVSQVLGLAQGPGSTPTQSNHEKFVQVPSKTPALAPVPVLAPASSGVSSKSATKHVEPRAPVPQSAPAASSRDRLPEGPLKAATPVRNTRNVNNLEVKTTTASPDSRGLVQLSDIYHKYSTIETPSDRFSDRNRILNGSAEEIDEDVLPSLMRKKSLMHGPYPASDRHLLDSDSDSDHEKENDSDVASSTENSTGSSTSFVRGSEAPNLLAVPRPYENRNPSSASVQSPLTQYNEFNHQFSKSVDRRAPSPSASESSLSFSDASENSNNSATSSPPHVPGHGPYPVSPVANVAQKLPQIQQLLLLHSAKQHSTQPLTPSLGEKFDTSQISGYSTGPTGPKGPGPTGRGATSTTGPKHDEIAVQKSRAMRNLNMSLESREDGQNNKPRYIKSPAASQNCSPRDFAQSAGSFPQQSSAQENASVPGQAFLGYKVPDPPQAFHDALAQMRPVQQRPHPQQQYQQSQPHSQPQRMGPPSQQYPGLQPQQRPPPPQQEKFYLAKQYPQSLPRGPVSPHYYDQGKPLGQQYQPAPRIAANPQQNYGKSQGRPVYGSQPQGPPMQQQNGYPQQQGRPVPQVKIDPQRQAHGYGARVLSSEQKQPGPGQQAHPLNRPPMQQAGHAMPPRPQAQQQQSALNIRSYGEQQYQYQVQPNFQPGQRPQPQQQQPPQQHQQYQESVPRQNDQRVDPRTQNNAPGQGYMRQY